MAFVYRAASQPPEKNGIGPGSYNFQDIIQSKPIGYAPFESTVERFPKEKTIKKKEFYIPGPGAYNISQDLVSEKILVSNNQNDMKIIEVPKESSVFKSKTKKMEKRLETKDITPGPGSYNQSKIIPHHQVTPSKESMKSAFLMNNEQKSSDKHSTLALVDSIRKENVNYQLIPSIPSKKEAFGYTESEARELVINNNPMIKYSGDVANSVGPGEYESKDSLEKKGYSWWKSNSKRIVNMKSQTLDTIGPGAYNPSLDIRKLYMTKPTSAFLSQINRSSEKKHENKLAEMIEKKNRLKINKIPQLEESQGNISAFEEQAYKNLNDVVV